MSRVDTSRPAGAADRSRFAPAAALSVPTGTPRRTGPVSTAAVDVTTGLGPGTEAEDALLPRGGTLGRRVLAYLARAEVRPAGWVGRRAVAAVFGPRVNEAIAALAYVGLVAVRPGPAGAIRLLPAGGRYLEASRTVSTAPRPPCPCLTFRSMFPVGG